MNTNHTTTNTSNNMKERIMKIVKEIMQGIACEFKEKRAAWLVLWASFWTICSLAMIELLSQFFDKATIFTTIVFVISTTAIGRIMHYFMKTKQSGIKLSLLSFLGAIYTQEDFEKFRETLTEELYKEMKNNAYVEISTEKEELEKERRKMKTFLRKHNTRGVVFEKFEEDILVDVGLFLGECFPDDLYENNTLKDFVTFFDENKEDFISSIQHVVHADCCMLSKMIEGLAYYCLDKKDLRELRKKLHKAYCNEKCSGIMLYEYRKEEEQLAGGNEATFRC